MDFDQIEIERIADVTRQACLELQRRYGTHRVNCRTCVAVDTPRPSQELANKLNIALRSLVAPTVLNVYIDEETHWLPIMSDGELNFSLTNIPVKIN